MRREPIGTVVVPLVSYFVGGWMIGWASVPYNLQWAQQFPKRSATMSLAGPAANLFLVILSGLVIRVGMAMGFFDAPDSITFMHVVASTTDGAVSTVATFLDVFFSLNLLLCIFNLLPIPPLDGSGMIPFFLNDGLSRKYLMFIRNPAFSIMGILVAWRVFDVIYSPLHLACVNLLYTAVAYYE
jgi:Zn-dependent protease